MSIDIKLQLSKTVWSGRFLDALLGKLPSSLMRVAAPLAKNVSASLATMASASVIDGAVQRKMSGPGVKRTGKEITLFILNEDMDDNRIIESLEKSEILTDRISKTEKHEIKNKKSDFLVGVTRNFGCFSVRKYANRNRCNSSWNNTCNGGNRI